MTVEAPASRSGILAASILARAWPPGAAMTDEALAAAVDTSRVAAPLIWCRLVHEGGAAAHPRLAETARRLAARDALASARLSAVLARLDREGIAPLVLKGAGLSARCYPEPWLRPRNDDDVLVDAGEFERAGAVLRALGYRALPQNPGPEVTGQSHFMRTFGERDVHHVDLHWRACVPAAFSALPDARALRRAAVPVPLPGYTARTPGRVDTVLLLCAHRVAHHGIDEDPMWLVDLHLAVAALGGRDWPVLVGRAHEAGVAAVCAFELTRLAGEIGSTVPRAALEALERSAPEASARHLEARGRLARLALDAADDPRGAWHAVRVRLFPPTHYMATRYGVPRPLVPAAYVWRGIAGPCRWMLEAARRRWTGT